MLIGLRKAQPENGNKLEYFRKKILDHLSKLEKQEEKSVNKATLFFEFLMKAGFPVGTIRTWNGVKHIKGPDNKWRPKYDDHTRGAKMAISVLKKRIAAAKDEHEMMQLCLLNRDRFTDKNGYPLPFMQEFHNYIEDQKTVKTGKPKTAPAEGKTALQRMKELADKITEMKKEAVKNGTNKITYTGLDGKPVNLYYHSGRWNDRPSTVGEYKGDEAAKQKPKPNSTDTGAKTDFDKVKKLVLNDSNLKGRARNWIFTDISYQGRPLGSPIPGEAYMRAANRLAWQVEKTYGYEMGNKESMELIHAIMDGDDQIEDKPKDEKEKPPSHDEIMNEILEEFRQDNPGLTRHEEFLKLNELEQKAFVSGDKEAEKTASALKQKFYADEQKAHDEALKELKRQRDAKTAAEAKERSDAEKKRREAESAMQTPQRGTRGARITFTTLDENGNPVEPADETDGFDKIKKKYLSAKVIEGDEDEVQIGKETLSGKWKLVEADTPTASHDETTFHKTPGFPTNADGSSINDRDYEHFQANKDAVLNIASDFDGRALKFDSPVVVTTDGIVISGNNRTMSSKIAARKGTDKKYIEALTKRAKKFGFTEEQVGEFKNPRVVFEVKQEGNYSTEQFAKFNESGKKEMGPTEKAAKVSKMIKTDTIEAVAKKIDEFETIGELYQDVKASHQIYSIFKEAGLIGENETGRYFENGVLTDDGKTFIETALLGTVINEANLRGFNRPGCKSLRGTLMRALIPLVENKGMTGYSINKELNEAVDVVMQVAIAKDKFKSVEEFAQQQNMFESLDPVAVELAKKMEGTQKAFAEFMKGMNGGLKIAANGEADIFLGKVESKEDILNRFLPIKKAISELLNEIRGFVD